MQAINKRKRNQSSALNQIDLEDFKIIIDQISIPIAIVDSESQQILFANNLFTQESKFSLDELMEMQISSIINGIQNLKYSDGLILDGEFVRKNKEIYRCNFSSRLIGKKKCQAAIFFDIVKEEKEKEISILNSLIDFFLEINQVLSSPKQLLDSNIFLFNATRIFKPLEAGIYQEINQKDLLRISSHQNKLLPEKLPYIEFVELKKQDIWTPGKRVLNSIHRAGRLNNISLIITTPFNLESDSRNLLVLLFNKKSHMELLGRYTDIYCKSIYHFHKIEQIKQNNSDLISSVEHAETQARTIFENIQEAGFFFDKSGRILQANQAAVDLLGYDLFEIQKELITDIFSGEKILNNLFIEESIQLDQKQSVEIHDREGNKIPTTITIKKYDYDEDEKYLLLINNIQESIEQANAMAKLEKKAVLGEMVADFAHEVRNPINNISTGLQLIKSRLTIEDKNVVVVDRLINDCIRMNHLMDSILSFSRQQFNDFKPIDINSLIHKTASKFLDKAKSLNINLSVIKDNEKIIILGDARALEQVFVNIISNAIDALEDKGGVVSIKTEIEINKQDMVQISVSDTGFGIPEELRSKIFEPFVSGKLKGTGLGLAITKRIIDAHHGILFFDTYTTGTIISIKLPLFSQGELH